MSKSKELTLPEGAQERGINIAQWNTLRGSLYPGAQESSILMVLDYCRARQLDPMKKPCHIVPMYVRDAQTGKEFWRDVVMPGIYEYRTTAQRTGEYLGHSKPTYGDPKEIRGVMAPEWCEMAVLRWNKEAQKAVEFPVRVYFAECVSLNKEAKANARWTKAPIQMLTKCTEAAALREAFPDELGGEPTAEEMDGKIIEGEPQEIKHAKPRPGKEAVAALTSGTAGDSEPRLKLIADLSAKAEEGTEALLATWAAMSEPDRTLVGAEFGRIKKIAATASKGQPAGAKS